MALIIPTVWVHNVQTLNSIYPKALEVLRRTLESLGLTIKNLESQEVPDFFSYDQQGALSSAIGVYHCLGAIREFYYIVKAFPNRDIHGQANQVVGQKLVFLSQEYVDVEALRYHANLCLRFLYEYGLHDGGPCAEGPVYI